MVLAVKSKNMRMEMRQKSGFILFLTFWLLIHPFNSSGQILQPIITGLKVGDAKIVASHFYENIELVILDHELVCSKAQGEQILKDFFIHHKPFDFRITHQGGEDSAYAIGKLQTRDGNFRVYFLLKSKGGKAQIVQLRIDKD